MAFYYGSVMPTAFISIATDHVHVNNGFSVPRLSGWFLNNNLITTDTVDVHTTQFLVICSQFDARHPPTGVDSCELLVFRKGKTGKLVNLRATDRPNVDQVVNQ